MPRVDLEGFLTSVVLVLSPLAYNKSRPHLGRTLLPPRREHSGAVVAHRCSPRTDSSPSGSLWRYQRLEDANGSEVGTVGSNAGPGRRT